MIKLAKMKKQIIYGLDFKKIDKELKKAELIGAKTDGTIYNFNRFSLPYRFIEQIYNDEITLNEAINNQKELKILINKLIITMVQKI